MKTIWFIAIKDIRLLLGDKAAAFFAIAWPVMIAVLFGLMFSAGGSDSWSMQVAVADEDQTPGSRAFVRDLAESGDLTVIETTRAEASENVRRGKWTAYVVLPPGFGKTRDNPFWSEGARMEIGIDPSRKAEAGMLQGVLVKHMFSSMQDLWTDPDRMHAQMAKAREQVDQATDMDPLARTVLMQFLTATEQFFEQMPEAAGMDMAEWQAFDIATTDVVREQEGPRSSFEVTFPQGLAWGFICCAAMFGISLVGERIKGTLRRLQAAPLGRAHILGGKALACFLTMCLVSALILGIGIVAFGIRADSYLVLLMAVLATSACFVGIMMVVSVLGRTEQSANAFAWPIFMVMAMTGGGMVPLAFMPGWLRAASTFSPLKCGVLALEGAIWRGFSVREVLIPCAILVGAGALCFAIGVRLFRWEQEG